MIRHAWHYSWLCSWEGGTSEALRPNVTKSDLGKWKVRNTAPATQDHAHLTFMLQQRGDQILWGVGWRIRGQRFLCRMCTLLQYGWGKEARWPSNVTCYCRAARGPSQRANAGWYMRGGSGRRGVCNSHMLSPRKAAIEVDKERGKRGVMIIPQLMEISCQGRGAGSPGGLGCGCTGDTEALVPVFRNAFRSRKMQQVCPCFSVVQV